MQTRYPDAELSSNLGAHTRQMSLLIRHSAPVRPCSIGRALVLSYLSVAM